MDSESESVKSLSGNNFTECILILGKNLHTLSKELQDMFFKLANETKCLPEDVTTEVIDTLITILTTISSQQHPNSLEALTILLNYLRSDVRVFNSFVAEDFVKKIDWRKYLMSECKEVKRLGLEFVLFLLRYSQISLFDITTNADLIYMVQRDETNKVWDGIETLANHYNNISNANSQNQQMISKAFAELFTYIDDIKSKCESSVGKMKVELVNLKGEIEKKRVLVAGGRYLEPNEPVANLAQLLNMEENFNKRINQLNEVIEDARKENDFLKNKQKETLSTIELALSKAEETGSKTQTIIDMINTENQLIKYTRDFIMTRILKAENTILALEHTSITNLDKTTNEGIINLRINSIRNQIDTEIQPILNDMQTKVRSIDIQNNIKDKHTILIDKVNEKTINSIADMFNTALNTINAEVRAQKKLIEAMKVQIGKVYESQEMLKNGINKDIDLCLKQVSKQQVDEEKFKKGLEQKYKELSTNIEVINASSKQLHNKINDNYKEVNKLFEEHKNLIENRIEEQNKGIYSSNKKNEASFIRYENELKNINMKIVNLEEQKAKFAIEQEQYIKFTRIEERLLKLVLVEEKVLKIPQLEEKLLKADEDVIRLGEKNVDLTNSLNRVMDKLKAIETHITSESTQDKINELKGEFTKRIEQIKINVQDHLNTSWKYIQQFTNQHAKDKISKIKNLNTTFTTKLNSLEWLIRYNEYISGKLIYSVIEAFKQIVSESKVYDRTIYATAKHNSDIMIHLVYAIKEINKSLSTEDRAQVLSDIGPLIAILEVTLMNDQNVETGISLGIIKEIVDCITFFILSTKECKGELTIMIKCLLSCFQSNKASEILVNIPNAITHLVSLLEEEELIIDIMKIIKSCLRDDKSYDKVIQQTPNLLNSLFTLTRRVNLGEDVVEELMGGLKNYTKKSYVLELIEDPKVLEPLCKIVSRKEKSKCKDYCISILKNCSRNPRLLEYMRKEGVNEIFTNP